jgi:PPOX class probable F420-dependent enzyme
MKTMSQLEIEAFLQAPRHAIVGTNTLDGPPQLSPVWYLYEDGHIYISIDPQSAKYHNLQRDARISVCIDGGYPDYRTVIIYGTAKLTNSGTPLQETMRWRIIRKYHDTEEEARAYAEAVQDQPAVLVIVTPQKIITQDFN